MKTTMKIKNAVLWQEWITKNVDPYGAAVVEYAARWAEAMEAALVGELKVADVAKNAEPQHGITGFMYGMAVRILSDVWERGEELRIWHNLETQIGTEGERANASGGVLNPAIISVGASDDPNPCTPP